MPKHESFAPSRLPGMPPPVPRTRMAAGTPAPAFPEPLAFESEYDDSATEIDGPQVAQKKWLDSIETIPFDPSMRVNDLGEGTPPRAVPPVRVPRAEATPRIEAAPRPARRGATPRPATQRPAQRPPARHPHDNVPTRLNHVDVAGGHLSFSPDPDVIPTPMPLPPAPMHALYGAPALPPHVPTAMALPPQAIMPTQVAMPVPAQVAHSMPSLVRPYEDGVTPYPVPPWAGAHPAIQQSAVQQRGYSQPVPQNHLDIYADGDERHESTERVAALSSSTPSLRPPLSRYLLPMIGGTAILVFVAGYFLVRGDGSSQPAAAPIASAAAMPVHAAPVVTELPAEPQLPASSWKQRDAKPTIVANVANAANVANVPTAEPVAATEVATPVVDERAAAPVATEIEMPAKPKATSRSTSHASKASRHAKRVAAFELPTTKPAPAKAVKVSAAKPTGELAKSAKKSIARSAKAERDPVLDEIEKPATSSQPKGTGPGKLMVSSSIPTLIYVDGRSTNLMTPKTLNLSAGSHKITLLELKSRKAKTVDIDVASGAVAKLDKKF
jgi:hypothetical protein